MRLRMVADGSIFFSFELIYREGEGPPQIGTLTKTRSAAGLHASRDSLYRTACGRRQVRSGVMAFPLALLPRRCPRCSQDTITGHGRRRKQAYDEGHDWIWIRRGVCRPCGLTFTILPHWSPPYGHYSFRCREQAWEATATTAALGSSRFRRPKTPIACPIRPPCGAGPGAGCSACTAVWRLLGSAGPTGDSFCVRPPSLPGIGRPSAVFCQPRQEVHESPSPR